MPKESSGSRLQKLRIKGFTQMSNDVILDHNLSYKAKGIFLQMWAKPDGYRFSSDRLCLEATDGRDAVQSGLRELRDAGYLLLLRVGGTDPHSVYMLRESLDISWPETGKPVAGESSAGDANAGNPLALVSTEKAITEVVSTEITRASADFAFDAFWKSYPRKEGKPAAALKFNLASTRKATPVEIMTGLARWVVYWEARGEPEFIPHPATWLYQERWNDTPPPLSAPKGRNAGIAGDQDMLAVREKLRNGDPLTDMSPKAFLDRLNAARAAEGVRSR